MFLERPAISLAMGPEEHLIVMKNLKGERDALDHASALEWASLRVLIESPGRGKLKKLELNSQTLRGWLTQISQVVPAGKPVYLQFPGMNDHHHVHRRQGNVPALIHLFELCREAASLAIPVVAVSASTAVTSLIAEVVAADQRGVCLRLDAKAILPSGITLQSILEDKLQTLGLEPSDVDLVVDFGFLVDDAGLDVADVRLVLSEIPAMASWRSLAVLGTSVPPTMSCVPEGTIGRLDRREWAIWLALAAASLVRQPTYGDYGIQGPKDPAQTSGPGMRANIRYTLENATIVARARGSVVVEGQEQYAELCGQIVALNGFRGAAFSWGDAVIDECARGHLKPGAQAMWRGAGTSHHLAAVREQLANQQPAAADEAT